MADTETPLTRSRLLRRCLAEVAIGFVAVVVVVVYQGGWQLIESPFATADFWGEVGAIAVVILAAAALLAIRDYRAGLREIRRGETEKPEGESA